MPWPSTTEYNDAIQNLRTSVSDDELRAGELARTPLALPMLWSGNFADVYKVQCPATGNTWAVKCFTRESPGLRDRYREISTHLKQARLPFIVDFQFVEPGIRAGGGWYPFLKMRWVEGLALNQFVAEYLENRRTLERLLPIWRRLSEMLRKAKIAHCDLQHGNVLLVPARARRRLSLKLIDYDGMYVPSLGGRRSAELGHPSYQHPQRLREGLYNAEVDRFSHLAVYCAVHCLTVGARELWTRFDNGDNLLFREVDFQSPGTSEVFQELWAMGDPNTHALVGRLVLATQTPLARVPLLSEVVSNGTVRRLSRDEEAQVGALLDRGGSAVRVFRPFVAGQPKRAGRRPPPLPSSRSGVEPTAATSPQPDSAARAWTRRTGISEGDSPFLAAREPGQSPSWPPAAPKRSGPAPGVLLGLGAAAGLLLLGILAAAYVIAGLGAKGADRLGAAPVPLKRPESAGPNGKIELRLHLEPGQAYQLRNTTVQKMRHSLAGARQEITQTTGLGFTHHVKEVRNDGTAVIQVTYDWVQHKMEGPMGKLLDYDSSRSLRPGTNNPLVQGYGALIGESFWTELTPQGRPTRVVGADQLVARMAENLDVPASPLGAMVEPQMKEQFGDQALKELMEQMMGFYPDQAVGVGDTWTRKMVVTKGQPMVMNNTWTLKSRKDGVALIDVESTLEPNPDAGAVEAGPGTLRHLLRGTQQGSIELDEATGWVLRSTFKRELSGDLALGGGPPVTISLSSEIRVEGQ